METEAINAMLTQVAFFLLGVMLGFVFAFLVRTVRIIEAWEKAKQAHRTNEISRSWRRSSKRDSFNPCGKE